MEIQGDKEMRQGIRMSQHIIIDERLEKKKNTHTHTSYQSSYMVVNFRARGISRGARKLARTPTLN
jgi:hypothetical protein